jgi:hypothetical protein
MTFIFPLEKTLIASIGRIYKLAVMERLQEGKTAGMKDCRKDIYAG